MKLQAHQLGRLSTALRRDFEPMATRGLWRPLAEHPPKLLLLYRRNLAQAVGSFHFSLCSGCFDQGRIFTYQHRPMRELGDPRALHDDLAAYRVHLEWLVDALSWTPYPIYGLAFEDLIFHQEKQIEALLHVIDPIGGSKNLSYRKKILDFRIARDDSPWESERQQWLSYIQDRIKNERIMNHPQGLRAQELLQIISSRCCPLPCR